MALEATTETAGKLVIRNIGLILSGDIGNPILAGDAVLVENGKISAIGREKDFRLQAADHITLEVLRDDHHEIRVAPPQRFLARRHAGDRAAEIEIGRVLHAGDHGACAPPRIEAPGQPDQETHARSSRTTDGGAAARSHAAQPCCADSSLPISRVSADSIKTR